MKNHTGHKKSRIWEQMRGWKGIWFHVAGIIAIVWFLIRVIPKPQRAQYPCQQVAISMSFGYLAFWSVLFTGLVIWLRNVKTRVAKTVPTALVSGVVLCTITGAVFATNYLQGDGSAVSWTPLPNEPMGVGTGVHPGRVVWVWDPNATEEDLVGYWWEQQNNDQEVIDHMVSRGVQELTGTSSDADAWNALFCSFNQAHGNGNVSYQPGEKIAIKLNFNNAWTDFGLYSYLSKDNERDASPYVVKALLHQLVNVVGVAQEDLVLFDASRPIQNWFYNRVYYKTYPAEYLVEEFSSVHYVDLLGRGAGREQVIPSSTTMYFSDGVVRTLPTCVVDANYLINIPLLKRHPINMGITLSGKNFFGSFIEPVWDIHPYHISGLTMGNAAPQVDLLAYEHLGGKTLLYLGDGTFGTKVDHKTIAKFFMYPFNDDWTNSLFFSQDPVALDSVMFDFLFAEGTNPIEGSQNYLHQAAVPPVGVYDPEHDGTYLSTSLGVHEHWDQTVDIFSSQRYVGSSEHGIEYIAVGAEGGHPGVVFTSPQEHHLYLFGEDRGAFPFTVIIGRINVEAHVNAVSESSVQQMEFYLDNRLQYTDTEAPYLWTWDAFSFSQHALKVMAYDETGDRMSHEISIVKLL